MDGDNDGRFPSESLVDVRYPRNRHEELGDRSAWPWLPGSIVNQCGPDEWYVCVEADELVVQADGRPVPPGAWPDEVYHPCCFRDSSEIRPRTGSPPSMRRDDPARHSAQRCEDRWAGGTDRWIGRAAAGTVAGPGRPAVRKRTPGVDAASGAVPCVPPITDLLPAARAARDSLHREGHRLTRDGLVARLRDNGHPVRNSRLTPLLQALRSESTTPPPTRTNAAA